MSPASSGARGRRAGGRATGGPPRSSPPRPRARNCRDNERPPQRVLLQPLRTPGKGPLQRRPGGHGIGQSLPPGELLGGQDAAELDEREWVPLGGLAQPPRYIDGDGPSTSPARINTASSGPSVVSSRRPSRRRVERALAALADGQAGSRRSRRRAVRREEQRIVGQVDPVGVVHEDQQQVGLRGRMIRLSVAAPSTKRSYGFDSARPSALLQGLSLLRRDLR